MLASAPQRTAGFVLKQVSCVCHQTNPPLTVRMNIEPSSFGTVEFCNFGDELGKASIVFLMMSSWWWVET